MIVTRLDPPARPSVGFSDQHPKLYPARDIPSIDFNAFIQHAFLCSIC